MAFAKVLATLLSSVLAMCGGSVWASNNEPKEAPKIFHGTLFNKSSFDHLRAAENISFNYSTKHNRNLQDVSSEEFNDSVCDPFIVQFLARPTSTEGTTCECGTPSIYEVTCYLPDECSVIDGCGGEVCRMRSVITTFDVTSQPGTATSVSNEAVAIYTGADIVRESVRNDLQDGLSCDIFYTVDGASEEQLCQSCSLDCPEGELDLDCTNLYPGLTTNGCAAQRPSTGEGAIPFCPPDENPMPNPPPPPTRAPAPDPTRAPAPDPTRSPTDDPTRSPTSRAPTDTEPIDTEPTSSEPTPDPTPALTLDPTPAPTETELTAVEPTNSGLNPEPSPEPTSEPSISTLDAPTSDATLPMSPTTKDITELGVPLIVDVTSDCDDGGEAWTNVSKKPLNGETAVNDDKNIVYTPNPGFTGVDTFEYEVGAPGIVCSTHVVEVNVVMAMEENDSESSSTAYYFAALGLIPLLGIGFVFRKQLGCAKEPPVDDKQDASISYGHAATPPDTTVASSASRAGSYSQTSSLQTSVTASRTSARNAPSRSAVPVARMPTPSTRSINDEPSADAPALPFAQVLMGDSESRLNASGQGFLHDSLSSLKSNSKTHASDGMPLPETKDQCREVRRPTMPVAEAVPMVPNFVSSTSAGFAGDRSSC